MALTTVVSWEQWASILVRNAGEEYAYRQTSRQIQGDVFGYFSHATRRGRKIMMWNTLGYGWVVPATSSWDEPIAVLNTADVIRCADSGTVRAAVNNAYGLAVVGCPARFRQLVTCTSDGTLLGPKTSQLYTYHDHVWAGTGQRRAVKEVLWREVVAQRFSPQARL